MKTMKITQEQFKAIEWTGGKTDEIFIFPSDSSYAERKFQVRISSATIETTSSNFTKLSGVHRFISPLNNNLKLVIENKKIIYLNPFEVFEFDGEDKIVSEGRCRDFNLMIKANGKATMSSWNTELNPKIQLRPNKTFSALAFWIFSYDCKGIVFVDNQEVKIGKMEFIKFENINPIFEVRTQEKIKLLYGFIDIGVAEKC